MSEKKLQPAKVEAVSSLRERFGGYKDFFFANYRGMTVEQITNLRKELRKEKSEFKVVKNNFAKIAFRDLKSGDVDKYLVGPTAIAMVKEDASPVAKILVEFAKEVPTLELKAGLIGGTVFDPKQVEAFSKLPGKAQLLAMLMGTMKAPTQNLVYVLNGVTTKLVRTLQAVADQKAGK